MALTARSGQGYIVGGVTDTTPDWLGSYDEGYTAAQTQKETALRQQEAKQRMAESAAAEQRRALEFANTQADRAAAMEAAKLAAQMPSEVPFDATQGPGLMEPYQVPVAPEPRAPSEKYAGELAPTNNGAITKDQFIKLLPEWARLEQAEGLPPNYLETISMLESSGGVNTGTGQYTGIFQIGPEVAKDFGYTPEQLRDPRVNAQVAAKLASRNAKILRARLNREPQPWELYLAHQQGAGGAVSLLQNPNDNAVIVLAAAYGGDRERARQAVIQNGGREDMTAGEFANLWASKFGGALPQPFTGAPGVGAKDVPVVPGLQGQATRPGRMPSDIARLNPALPTISDTATEQTVAGGKSDLPAGVQVQPPPAAPPPGGTTTPGLQTQPSPEAPPAPPTQLNLPNVAARDLIPGVGAADYAGLNDGTGSLATAIARTRTGEVPKTPDTGLYIVEPMRITNDRRLLAAQKAEIQRQLQIASMTRDFATIFKLREQAAQNQLADNLMGAMETIATMQQGDDETFARTLSGLTQGRQRLQKRSDGTFNIYYDGQLRDEAVSRDRIIASLRMAYDQQYQALAKAQADAAAEREKEYYKGQIDIAKEIAKQQAQLIREIKVEMQKAALKPTEYNFSTVGEVIFAIPKEPGTGEVKAYRMVPVVDMNGEPVVDGAGNVKMVPQETGLQNAVPVQ